MGSTRRRRLPLEVYGNPGEIALLTICTRDRRRMFVDPISCEALLSVLESLHGNHWQVLAYVIMPDHLHALVMNIDSSLVEFVRQLKGRSANTLRRQSGIRGLWQRSFHDHLVRRTEKLGEVIVYVLENPVRAGLCDRWDEYPWSGSLRWPGIHRAFVDQHADNVLWSEALRD
jgi:REP element-mobilizing transposase RayT